MDELLNYVGLPGKYNYYYFYMTVKFARSYHGMGMSLAFTIGPSLKIFQFAQARPITFGYG
jgi:hypothetical protein